MKILSKIFFKLYKIFEDKNLDTVPELPKDPNREYKSAGIKIGENVRIFGTLDKVNPQLITIGSHCVIGTASALLTHGPTAGKKNVIIGDYVWIGYQALILPGVSIGNCSIVGAGAVVTKSFPEFSVVAGNPAKFLRKLSLKEIESLKFNLENRIPMGKVDFYD